MQILTGKTILILSPQSWGKMFVSKHHYAIELAKSGNTVYFLNPPEQGQSELDRSIEISPSGISDNLWVIRHKLWVPYLLKFHAPGLFHAGMYFQIKKILRRIKKQVDIIWSFDLGNLYPFRFFGERPLKIFHPVDEPLNKAAIRSAKGASVILSVTYEILEKYGDIPAGKYFINHGVSDSFLLPVETDRPAGKPVRIGFSGNLLRQDIDWDIFLQIVRENPAVFFECWGSYAGDQSNIGGEANRSIAPFIDELKGMSNVILHGPVSSDKLAGAIHGMDGFLICYDIEKDQSSGTNYHKIMEYLSTGKVIISNNVTTYRDQPELICMAGERQNNRQLPGIFKKVIDQMDQFNAPSLQMKRLYFARENTYPKQIERIDAILRSQTPMLHVR